MMKQKTFLYYAVLFIRETNQQREKRLDDTVYIYRLSHTDLNSY